MSLFKTDPVTGDWVRENGGFVRVSDQDEVLIHVTTRLRLIRGEVARDTRVGVQHEEMIWNLQATPAMVANHLAAVVLDTPGMVSAETQFETEPERGELTVELAGTFLGSDLRERRIQHERVLVRTGGSVNET